MMISAPAKPTASAIQRLKPTASWSAMAANRTVNSPVENSNAVASATGKVWTAMNMLAMASIATMARSP